jgi:hypothetical protein
MAQNANSLANLTPWPKGRSGNPAGRPPIDKDIQEFIEIPMDEDEDYGGGTRKQAILEKVFQTALGFGTNNLKACEILLNRACGRVPVIINHQIVQETEEKDVTSAPETTSNENNTN